MSLTTQIPSTRFRPRRRPLTVVASEEEKTSGRLDDAVPTVLRDASSGRPVVHDARSGRPAWGRQNASDAERLAGCDGRGEADVSGGSSSEEIFGLVGSTRRVRGLRCERGRETARR